MPPPVSPAPAAEPALVVPLRPRALSLALALTVLLVFALALAADSLARSRGGPLPDGLARRLGFTYLIGLPRVVNGALLLAAAGTLSVLAALTPPTDPYAGAGRSRPPSWPASPPPNGPACTPPWRPGWGCPPAPGCGPLCSWPPPSAWPGCPSSAGCRAPCARAAP